MRKKRIILLLVTLVLLPLGFLGWQGLQMLNSSDSIQNMRAEQLIEARLKNVDTNIQTYLRELALDWSNRLPNWSLKEESLRAKRAREIRVKQLFLLDKTGKRTFPIKEMTQTEQQFIERMQTIWDDPSMLYGADDSNQLEEQSYTSKWVTRSKANEPELGHHGWTQWHWGSGSRLLFWWKAPQGYTLGLEIESARIKSDLISLLPDQAKEAGYSIRLKDAAGQIIYQWGRHEINKELPLNTYALTYPLSSWSLEYFGKNSIGANTANFGLLILFFSMALALSGLAIYLYREHSRDIRLAAQRVAFVGQVSHELKTPLTNIRLYAEMLEDQLDDEPQKQRYLQVITNESQRLSRLINNVLNFSREPILQNIPVNIDHLIQSIVDNFQAGFMSREIKTKLNLQVKKSIETDPDQLEQILNNLLSNVEKYAADGKAVDISSQIKDEILIIQVRDYGSGIPTGERNNIFKPFYRISNRLTEGVSGTGIGLTLAKQQAKRLGGDLILINVTPGACLELRIPVVKNT